jgi:hypothetical protein
VLLPPVPGAATVILTDDARIGFGTWGTDKKVTGVVGVPDDSIVSFRQNLDALLDHGQINPTGRNLWGFTLPGKGMQTERSGLCVTTAGHLLYAWGDDVSATTLAKAMKMAGCDYGMHLDMNPYHTGFLFTAIDDIPTKKYKTELLSSGMEIPTDRYIQYAPKDFFYVLLHDPTPALVEGAAPWQADGGAQPAPKWLPGLWTTRVDVSHGTVELLDVEAGRAMWRARAGIKESPGTQALRELGGEESKRALLAVGVGVAPATRPRGLATDGRQVVPMHGTDGFGAIVIDDEGRLSIAKAAEVGVLGAHGDAIELPLLLWDGVAVTPLGGAAMMRAALGTAPGGRVMLARGTFGSDAPLVEALARAGCTRVVALDRGSPGEGVFDRAGTQQGPRARYDESVLFAIATPLKPRGFRFDPKVAVAQAGKK